MSLLKFGTVIFLTWQLCVARSIWNRKRNYIINVLTPEQVERLSRWTKDSKQNIWELGGQTEGDMILRADQRNGIIDVDGRWPMGVIPYVIDPDFTNEQKEWIIHSLTEYYNKTCIKPRPWNSKDKDYVYVARGGDCSSLVGRQGGQQFLFLRPDKPGNGCLKLGTIVHEFMHALGFYHQHSARNRDDYVKIVWKNIEKDKERYFEKRNDTTSFGENYDYGSLMHYSAYAFSKNKQKTIIALDPNAAIGQRAGLSKIDAIKLNKMYKCRYF